MGTHLDHPVRASIPTSMALVLRFARSLPCSTALGLQFLAFLWMDQHGPNEGVRNIYKINACFILFEKEGRGGSGLKMEPEEQNIQNRLEKYILCTIAL